MKVSIQQFVGYRMAVMDCLLYIIVLSLVLLVTLSISSAFKCLNGYKQFDVTVPPVTLWLQYSEQHVDNFILPYRLSYGDEHCSNMKWDESPRRKPEKVIYPLCRYLILPHVIVCC